MLKLLLLILGLAAGAGGAAGWLLSEPGAGDAAPSPSDRLGEARQRLQTALAEGRAAGAETENRLRHQLDAYRRHPDRPATS